MRPRNRESNDRPRQIDQPTPGDPRRMLVRLGQLVLQNPHERQRRRDPLPPAEHQRLAGQLSPSRGKILERRVQRHAS